MDLELKEVTDEELAIKESEIMDLVGSFSEPTDHERIESILQRAKLETVVKDSADFAAIGVGKGLMGVLDTLSRLGDKEDKKDSKRSY